MNTGASNSSRLLRLHSLITELTIVASSFVNDEGSALIQSLVDKLMRIHILTAHTGQIQRCLERIPDMLDNSHDDANMLEALNGLCQLLPLGPEVQNLTVSE